MEVRAWFTSTTSLWALFAPCNVVEELALAMALPGWLLSFVMRTLRWLDTVNLKPRFMIESDPLYTSLFVANLGSVGLDRTYHHLYEEGTASVFGALGVPRKETVLNRHGKPQTRELLEARWTVDERVADGFYCAASLKVAKRIMEDPAAHIKVGYQLALALVPAEKSAAV